MITFTSRTQNLLQQRDNLTVCILVNLAVAVEGLATFFVTGEWTDQVRVLNLIVYISRKGPSRRVR